MENTPVEEFKHGFSIDEEPIKAEESLPSTALRNVSRTAARGVETLLNIPEGFAKLGIGAANLGIKASNYMRPEGEEAAKEIEYPKVLENLGEKTTGLVSKVLPKKYLEPQGQGERFSDEFFSDLTSLATPIPGLGKAATFKRALAVSGLGNLASWAAEDIGASEGTKSGIKIGTMLAATMAGRGKLNATKKKLYNQAESALKENVRLPNKFVPVANKLELSLEKGSQDAASKQFIKKRLEDIQANTVGDKISIGSLLELKKDWNEIRYTSGMPKRATPAFNELTGKLHEMINDYGKTNPAFYNTWKKAEDIHQGLTKASSINRWMQTHVTPLRIGGATASLLLGHSMGLPHVVGTGAGMLAGTVGAKYGIKAFEALKNSPEIRKYYMKTVASAAKKNISATTRNAMKLDKAVEQKIEDMNPKEGFSLD